MKAREWMVTLALLGLAVVQVGAAETETRIEAKAQACESAATIDFQKTLQLPFDSLTTLGVRIEQARKAGDPVGLAVAANELAAAEKAASKKADLTASVLKKEAVELAKLRDNFAELTAVQSLTDEDLSEAIKAAAKRQEEDRLAAKEGSRSRGIFHELVVDNGSEVHVTVYVNGRYVGCLEPYGHGHFPVHTHHETVLDASGSGHRWHSHVHGDYNSYYWTLND